MYLAWKEILYSKTRYILIVVVILLSTYLNIFLSGLAYGLAQDNRSGIDTFGADGLVLNSKSNNQLVRSQISPEQLADVQADTTAPLSVLGTLIEQRDKETSNAYIFGIEDNTFIVPEVDEGRLFSSSNEIVVDSTLQTKYDYKLQDTLKFEDIAGEYKIVGFVKQAQYTVAPIVYMNQTDFEALNRLEEASPMVDFGEKYVNAIVYRGEAKVTSDQLTSVSIKEFVNDIPGYRPEVLTFALMISFLVGIVAFVLSIFMYVLTIQKHSMFGIMKAQGIRGRVILMSVLNQTLILTILGIVLGCGLLGLTLLFLPASVPFQLSYPLLSTILLSLLLFSTIGTFFSLRSIIKLDPITAMGG